MLDVGGTLWCELAKDIWPVGEWRRREVLGFWRQTSAACTDVELFQRRKARP